MIHIALTHCYKLESFFNIINDITVRDDVSPPWGQTLGEQRVSGRALPPPSPPLTSPPVNSHCVTTHTDIHTDNESIKPERFE